MCDLGVHERRLSCQCFQKGSLIGKSGVTGLLAHAIAFGVQDGSNSAYDIGMPLRRIALLILYAIGAATMILVLAPLVGWWSIPLGLAAFVIFLKLPYYRDWQ